MRAVVETEPLVDLDYAVVVDARTLVEPEFVEDPADVRLLVAARVGPVRLIDNSAAVEELQPQSLSVVPVVRTNAHVADAARQLERIG
jgi:hypothetical protein